MDHDNTRQPALPTTLLRGLWFVVRRPIFTLLVILSQSSLWC
jgi:hypothetical protein